MAKRRTTRRAPEPLRARASKRPVKGRQPTEGAVADAERLHTQSQDEAGLHKLIADLQTYQEEARQQQEQLIEVQKYLEDSRDRFADLYDFAPIGYVTLDGYGVIEEINLTGTLLLGVERERLIGMPLLAHVVKEDRQRFLQHMHRCRAGQLHVNTELRVKPRNSLPIYVHLSSRHGPMSTSGRATYRTAIVDITDLKQRDAELEKYRQRLRSLTNELATTEERERRRIATALHDNHGQVLALARIKLGGLAKTCAGDGAASSSAPADIAQLQQLLGEAIRQTRTLTLELSPPVLSLGLEAAVEWLGEQNRQHGLEVQSRSFLRSPQMPEEVKLLLFQAVRELLNNVIKHAHARRAVVTLRNVGGRIEVTVEDDGTGMPASGDDPFLMRGDGFGLFSLRTRLEHLGGSLHISPSHGGGTLVTVNVPSEPEKGPAGVSGPEADGAAASLTRPGSAGSNVKEVTSNAKPTSLEDHAGRRSPDRPRGAAERARGRAGHDGRGGGG